MRKSHSHKTFFKIIMICIICICWKTQGVSAKSGNVYALICTGSNVDAKVLKNSIAEMKKVLSKNKLKNNTVTQIFEANPKSTKAVMDRKISAAYKNCLYSDIAVFYYNGHGYPEGRGLAVNDKFSYSCKDLIARLNKVKCEKMIVIIDACYSGSFYEPFYKYGLNSLKKSDREKFILFLSCKNSEISDFAAGFSRYTHTLAAGLGNNGKVYADLNENGTVTATELSEYINIQMKNQLLKPRPVEWRDVHPVFYASNKNYPVFQYKTKAQASIKLNKTTATIYMSGTNRTVQLKATVTGASKKVIWKSSNSAVASVSSTGKVTAKSAGKAVIMATANGKTAKCTVTVKKLVVDSKTAKAKAAYLEYLEKSEWLHPKFLIKDVLGDKTPELIIYNRFEEVYIEEYDEKYSGQDVYVGKHHRKYMGSGDAVYINRKQNYCIQYTDHRNEREYEIYYIEEKGKDWEGTKVRDWYWSYDIEIDGGYVRYERYNVKKGKKENLTAEQWDKEVSAYLAGTERYGKDMAFYTNNAANRNRFLK